MHSPTLTMTIMALLSIGFIRAQSKDKGSRPTESPEHAFARSEVESVKRLFGEKRTKYDEQMKDNPGCSVRPELIKHPVTFSSAANYMFKCFYESKMARYEMDKTEEFLAVTVSRLDHVDDCLKTYHNTIDKKVSDQTTREVDQIKACREEHLYPPQTK
jgi:hypothetical protein